MSLIRGVGSKFPCPICLVPQGQLINPAKIYNLRTTESIIAVVQKARQQSTVAEGEDILKNHGLRGINVCNLLLKIQYSNCVFAHQNAFWAVANSDPYAALSWDRLHAYHGGLFSDHLWSEVLEILGVLGKNMAQLVDNQYVFFR
jgi:hypothetical protein